MNFFNARVIFTPIVFILCEKVDLDLGLGTMNFDIS